MLKYELRLERTEVRGSDDGIMAGMGWVFLRLFLYGGRKYELRSTNYEVGIEAGGARAYENKRGMCGVVGGMMGCGYGCAVDRGAVQACAGFLG